MEVVIRGKHITVPEQIKDHARTKFGKLDRYLPLLREADVEISREGGKKAAGQRYVVQVTVNSSPPMAWESGVTATTTRSGRTIRPITSIRRAL